MAIYRSMYATMQHYHCLTFSLIESISCKTGINKFSYINDSLYITCLYSDCSLVE